MGSMMLSNNWTVQAGIHSGTDMAPWYKGAIPTGMLGLRWVADSNKDSVYTVLNAINNAKFRYFELDGQPFGHDNFNYIVSTWQHKFNDTWQTRTEGYFMWERDAVVGGTPSIGSVQPYGSGGGIGATIPGMSHAFGLVNFTVCKLSDRDLLTFRNEWYHDQTGFRTGFAGNYGSTTVCYSHNINSFMQVRPEIGWYRNFDRAAFDNGTRKDMVMVGADFTYHF